LKVAVIPAPGSGLASMARTGQLERFYAHLAYYAARFHLTYVTWGDYPEEARLWRPFAEQAGARLVHASQREWRHADVFRCMNLAATKAVLRIGRPFVCSIGADYAAIARIHGRRAWKWKLLQAVALRWAARVLVPNRQMATDLMVRYPGRPIVHHPNWVDVERFCPESGLPRGGDRRVLYVGRLVKEKNLEALAAAVAAIPKARLVLVGEGPLRARLTALGAECVGPQPWTSLPHWYRGADVFCLPSLTEGHPKALAEAMACGLACIVSWAVSDGGDAVWRTSDFEGGIRDLLQWPWVAQDFGQRARRYAVEHWDARQLIPKELDWVEEAGR